MQCYTILYGRHFFFSSRRRHTRFKCDWSSDVCSSDLKSRRDQRRWPGEFSCSQPRLYGNRFRCRNSTTTRAQITQQARRAFVLRAMVHPWPPLIDRDLVSPVSHHRWTVSTTQPRRDKRRVLREFQFESHGPAKFLPSSTEITGLRGH